MKFLYFGDRHNTYKNPPNRLDNYQETTKNKDLEIIDIGRKNNVAAFLHPGDFWNEKEVNGENDFIQEIVNRWGMINVQEVIQSVKTTSTINKDLLEKINNYIPVIGIAGNHDLIGNSLDTLPMTTTGFLAGLGQMNLVTKESPMFFKTEDGVSIAITGTHYHINMDEPEYIDDYIVKEKLADIHIHIVHGMLSEKNMGTLIKHTLIDRIKETKADITLCGHNHIGFGIKNIDGKYFINIGGVVRISNDLKEINREPSVALIDISKKGIEIEEIKLTTALPGIEILDRSFVEEDAEKKEVIKTFKKEISSLKDSGKKVDIVDFVKKAATEKGISPEIEKDILDRLVNKELLAAKIKTECDDSYIEEIIIENFQSHEYSRFKLDKGFNVFVGESRQGKSAVQRAFDWVYENKPTGSGFIKRKKPYAKVTIIKSNGYIVSRLIENKKGGKNTFEIIYPDGHIETGNTKLIDEVQRVLGFNYFNVDSKLSLPVNFYKQGDPWYLIGKGISSTDKARVIGALNGTNHIDAIIRDLNSENDKIVTYNKVSEKKCKELTEEIDSLNFLPDLEVIIKKNQDLLKLYEALKEKKEKIEELSRKDKEFKEKLKEVQECLYELKVLESLNKNVYKYKDISNKYNEISKEYLRFSSFKKESINMKEIIDNLKNLDNLHLQLTKLKEFDGTHKQLQKISETYSKSSNDFKNILQVIKELDISDELNVKLKKLKELSTNYSTIKDLNTKTNKIVENLKDCRETITKTSNLEDITDMIREFDMFEKLKNDVLVSIERFSKVKENLDKSKLEIEKASENLNNRKLEYSQILKEIDLCPVCKRPMDEHSIEEIIKENN